MITLLVLCVVGFLAYKWGQSHQCAKQIVTVAADTTVAATNVALEVHRENLQLKHELNLRDIGDLCGSISDQVEYALSRDRSPLLMPGMAIYHAWSGLHDTISDLHRQAVAADPVRRAQILSALQLLNTDTPTLVAERAAEVERKFR